MWFVAGVLDDPEASSGDPRGQLFLAVGWEHEVLPSRHHQRRDSDLGEAVLHRPAFDQMATSEDERLRPRLRAPPAVDHGFGHRPQERSVVVRASDPHGHRIELSLGEFAVEPASDQLHLLVAVAPLGHELGRVLL